MPATALRHHPRYGLDLALGNAWQDKLEFIASETSFGTGGLIEGALETARRFSRRVASSRMPLSGKAQADEASSPHSASMTWDWL